MSGTDQLRKDARQIKGIPKTGMLAAVKAVKNVGNQAAASAAGGDLMMSRMGKAGVKLTLRDNLKVGTDQATAVVSGGKATGAWVISTYGAKPHEIGGDKVVGRGKSKRNTGRRKIRIGQRIVTGPIPHPGARGKGTFETVVKRANVLVPKVFEAAVDRVVK